MSPIMPQCTPTLPKLFQPGVSVSSRSHFLKIPGVGDHWHMWGTGLLLFNKYVRFSHAGLCIAMLAMSIAFLLYA